MPLVVGVGVRRSRAAVVAAVLSLLRSTLLGGASVGAVAAALGAAVLRSRFLCLGGPRLLALCPGCVVAVRAAGVVRLGCLPGGRCPPPVALGGVGALGVGVRVPGAAHIKTEKKGAGSEAGSAFRKCLKIRKLSKE